MARVCLWEAPDYDHVRPAVEAALETFRPDVAGKTVLVKPNLLGAVPPDRPVCTHPSVVRAICEALEARGAGKVLVGDNPGMRAYGSNEETARTAGLLEAAGDRYVNLGASPVRTPVQSEFADTLAVSREVLEADLLVSLPKMKTHVATGITGAVKNTYGYLVGAEKTRLHQAARGPEAFARAVLDVFAIRPPTLSILDAVVGMEGQGPSGGKPRQVGRIVASRNAVALDALMCRMMGLDPERVPMLRVAAERGLGPIAESEIDVEGPMSELDAFEVPGISMGLGGFAARVASHLFVTRPRVRYDKCVRCGSCEAACPVDAIEMTARGPEIDPRACIACFCCHEMCRYEAMDLTRRMRWLRGVRR